jgi:hypothetical protein
LLEQQQRLRAIVDDREFHLLERALKHQFILNVMVYVSTVAFCGWSVYLFVQSQSSALVTSHATPSHSASHS